MVKAVVVNFTDGRSFAVPAHIFAHERAKYYAEIDSARGDGEYDEVYKAEYEYTMGDEGELLEYIANNTYWGDAEPFAVELPSRARELDYEDEWTNADREIVDLPDDTFPKGDEQDDQATDHPGSGGGVDSL